VVIGVAALVVVSPADCGIHGMLYTERLNMACTSTDRRRPALNERQCIMHFSSGR